MAVLLLVLIVCCKLFAGQVSLSAMLLPSLRLPRFWSWRQAPKSVTTRQLKEVALRILQTFLNERAHALPLSSNARYGKSAGEVERGRFFLKGWDIRWRKYFFFRLWWHLGGTTYAWNPSVYSQKLCVCARRVTRLFCNVGDFKSMRLDFISSIGIDNLLPTGLFRYVSRRDLKRMEPLAIEPQ